MTTKSNEPEKATPEILAEIEQQKARLDQLEQERRQQDEQIARLKGGRAGWLITAKNPLWSGRTAGLQFQNGLCFIDENKDYPQFRIEKIKQTTLERMYPVDLDHPNNPNNARNMAERERVREREAISTAQRAALEFRGLQGYTVERFEPSQHAELTARYEKRAREAAEEKGRLASLGPVQPPHRPEPTEGIL